MDWMAEVTCLQKSNRKCVSWYEVFLFYRERLGRPWARSAFYSLDVRGTWTGLKRPGCETGRSPSPCTAVQNELSYAPTPQYVFPARRGTTVQWVRVCDRGVALTIHSGPSWPLLGWIYFFLTLKPLKYSHFNFMATMMSPVYFTCHMLELFRFHLSELS
jgi:hypothetical protein